MGVAVAPAIPVAAELFVAAVLTWISLNIRRTARDPKTPPAGSVLLDLGLVLVTMTALVFWFSAALDLLF